MSRPTSAGNGSGAFEFAGLRPPACRIGSNPPVVAGPASVRIGTPATPTRGGGADPGRRPATDDRRPRRLVERRHPDLHALPPDVDLLEHVRVRACVDDEVRAMDFARLQIDEETAGVARIAIAARRQFGARRQRRSIDLEDMRRRREAAVAVLAFDVADERRAFLEVQMDVRHAGFAGVLDTVAVAIREDRSDDAGVGGEDAAGDEDARPRHVRPHVAAGGVRAVDAVALQGADPDAHPVRDRHFVGRRLATGSRTSGRARRRPPDPAAAAPRRQRPGVPNRRCSGSRAAAGRSPTHRAASGRQVAHAHRVLHGVADFGDEHVRDLLHRQPRHAAPGEPSSVSARRRPAAASPESVTSVDSSLMMTMPPGATLVVAIALLFRSTPTGMEAPLS